MIDGTEFDETVTSMTVEEAELSKKFFRVRTKE
jgi:hypothetical protein